MARDERDDDEPRRPGRVRRPSAQRFACLPRRAAPPPAGHALARAVEWLRWRAEQRRGQL